MRLERDEVRSEMDVYYKVTSYIRSTLYFATSSSRIKASFQQDEVFLADSAPPPSSAQCSL